MFCCRHFRPIKHNQYHVEEVDAGMNTRRRRTSGCQIKPDAKSGVEDNQSVSNSVEFEYISQSGVLYSKKFKFGTVSRDSNGNTEIQFRDIVAKSTNNSVGARLFLRILKISPNDVDYFEKVYSNVRQRIWSSTRRRNGTDRRPCRRQRRRRSILDSIFQKICVPPRTRILTIPNIQEQEIHGISRK